jgi:hypothetical protein
MPRASRLERKLGLVLNVRRRQSYARTSALRPINAYDLRVPNRFTRVPERPVPRLPSLVLPVVVLADVFMAAMASRPATGSLRRTWVTPGTLELCIALTVVGLALGFFLFRLNAPLGLLVLVLTVGACSVAVVGLAQRLR